MKIELDTKIIVDDMLNSMNEDAETHEEKQKLFENYWSIILLDNLPRLENEIKNELKQRGFKL